MNKFPFMQISNQPVIWQQFNGYIHLDLVMVTYWISLEHKGYLHDIETGMVVGVKRVSLWTHNTHKLGYRYRSPQGSLLSDEKNKLMVKFSKASILSEVWFSSVPPCSGFFTGVCDFSFPSIRARFHCLNSRYGFSMYLQSYVLFYFILIMT